MSLGKVVAIVLCVAYILNGIQGLAFRPAGIWEKGIVIYELKGSMDDTNSKRYEYLMKVFAEIEKYTCIRFHEKSGNNKESFEDRGLTHTQEIRFENNGECMPSSIGYEGATGGGGHIDCELGKCDTNKRGMMRAVMQSLGFYYEHQRPDHGDHITKTQHTLDANTWRDYLETVTTDIDYTYPYDISSIMHGEETFEGYKNDNMNNNGKRYLQHHDELIYNSNTQEKEMEYLSGFSRGYNIPAFLSHRDKAAMNGAYQCTAACVDPPVCQNDGYVDDSCTCQCTPETYGTNCELLNDLDKYLCPDSSIKYGDGYLTSPDYPEGFKLGTECYWMIKSNDPTKKLAIRVLHMDLEECWFDSLKIYTYGPAVQTNYLSCEAADYNNYKYKWYIAETDTIYVQFRTRYAFGDSPDSGFRLQYGMGCIINGQFDILCGQVTVPPAVPGQECYICTKLNEACHEGKDLTGAMTGLCVEGEICKVTSYYVSISEREYVIANARACEPAVNCNTTTDYQCVQGTDSATCEQCCDTPKCNTGYAGDADALPAWSGQSQSDASTLNHIALYLVVPITSLTLYLTELL